MFTDMKCKITRDDITYGPTDREIDPLTVMVVVHELIKLQYQCVSNAYCRLARIDRDDWLEVLAKERRCTIADFYSLDGSGVPQHHKDHYARTYSKDIITVHPAIYKELKRRTHAYS